MASIKGRRHRVDKVYTCNDKADDLLLIGSVERYLYSGRTLETEWAARLVIDNASSEYPQLKLFNAWSVSSLRPHFDVLTGVINGLVGSGLLGICSRFEQQLIFV
jgi:hypothetical protein